MKRLLLMLIASVLLAACTSGMTLVRSQSASRYVSYLGGQLPIVIHGNLFGGSKADFDQAVARAAQSQLRNPSIALVVHDGTGTLPEFHAVMAFNAPRSQSPWGLCNREGGTLPSTENIGQIELLAAVCRGDDAIGWAIASAKEVSGVQSPSFQALVSRTADATLQVQPSIRRHGDGANR